MILLDSNILVRHAKPTDPAHTVARDAVLSLRSVGESLALVPQNLYEFWVVATRPVGVNGLGLTTAECQIELLDFERLYRLLPDDPLIYAEWKRLVVAHDCKGKVAYDARIAAAMHIHGLTRLLTFNTRDFVRFPGIIVLDPHAIAAPPNSFGP